MDDMVVVIEIVCGLRFLEGFIWQLDGSILFVEIVCGMLSFVSLEGVVSVVVEFGGGFNGVVLGFDGCCYVCNNGGFEWYECDGWFFFGDQLDDYCGGLIQVVDLVLGVFEMFYSEVEMEYGVYFLKGLNDLVFDVSGGFWFIDYGKN